MGQHNDEDFTDLGQLHEEPNCADIVRQLIWHFLEPVPPHLESNYLVEKIRGLAYAGRQAEGWFKVELLSYLAKAKTRGELTDFWPEVTYDWDVSRRRKCDFALRLNDAAQTMVGIEVKTAFVGKQGSRRLVRTPEGRWTVVQTAGQPWDLEYIRTEGAGHDGGVLRDVVRLCWSEGFDERVCLIYAYGEGVPSDPGEFVETLNVIGDNPPTRYSATIPNSWQGQTLFQGGEGFVQAFACWIRPKAPGNRAIATGFKPC